MHIKTSLFTFASLLGGLALCQAETTAPRTSAYADVMVNAAADNSVVDYTKRPTLIGDQQYIVGSGGAKDLVNGAFSIKGGAYNWFGSMTANTVPTGGPDMINLGLANTVFGAGVAVALGKTDVTVAGSETRTTYNMDGLGLFGNFRLSSSSDVYGKLSVTTDYKGDPTLDIYLKDDGGPTEVKNSVFGVMAGWKKDANKEGDHSLNLEGTLNIGSKKDGATPDTGSLLDVKVVLSHGIILKQTPGFAVFAGSTTGFRFLGETRNKIDSTALQIGISPNIEFQKTLAKGFEAFSGAVINVNFVSDEQGTAYSDWALMTTGADVSVGLRWNYENLALEGKITDAILFDGPDLIGGTAPGLFGEVGLAVGF